MAMEDGGPQILGYVLGRERLAASVLERLAASDPQAELRSSGDFGSVNAASFGTMRPALTALGVLLVALGIGLLATRKITGPEISKKINEEIYRQIVWQPDSPKSVQERYQGGTDDPPLLVRFYLLNITNLDSVRQGGKPVVDEIGPYAFYRHRRKLDVQFSPDNSTVSFNEFEYLTPCPEHSNGTLDDDITTLNIPLVGAIEAIQARASSMIAPWLLLLARLVEGWGDPRVAGLFTTRTAEELLFGYEDSLLRRASRILPGAGINPTFALVRNMSSEGESSKPPERNAMATGSTHLSDVCQFRTWHGVQQVRAWQPPHVEEVRGTDATQFRPGLGRGSSVEVWVGEAFRAMKLIQDNGGGDGGTDPSASPREGAIRFGNIPVLRFRPDPQQKEPNPTYYQYIRGLMNVTAPMAAGPEGPPDGKVAVGPPLFLSLPGYCGADASLAEGVEGIVCDHVRHETYIDVEPTTGLTLRATKRLMLSSWYGSAYSKIDSRIAESQFLPIFWGEETSEASASQRARFGKLLLAHRLQKFFNGAAKPLAVAATGIGAAITLVGISLSRPVMVWNEEEEVARSVEVEALLEGGGRAGINDSGTGENTSEPPH